MENITHIPHTSQEKNKTKNTPVWLRHFNKLLVEFMYTKDAQCFYNAIKRCSKMVKRVIALLLKMDCLYDVVDPRQAWIAMQVGSSSQSYMSDLLQALASSGFVRIIRRGWIPAKVINGAVVEPGRWRTNIYKFAPFLYDHKIRAELAGILPGCRALEYSLLMVYERQLLEEFPILLRPALFEKVTDTVKCSIIVNRTSTDFTNLPFKENYGCNSDLSPSNFG